MDIWTVLLDVVVLLGAGALLGGLFERLGQSAIIGYLLAGMVLGPHALHLMERNDEVLALSELGVALLLFAIGLEFSFEKLRKLGTVALASGLLQILFTGTIAGGLAALAGVSIPAAVAVGAIVAFSSTAAVVRLLAARGEIESVHGRRALGILLVQDIAVVPLVLVVTVLADGGSAYEVVLGLARATGTALALIAALLVAFHVIVPRLLAARPVHASREIPLLVAVVSGLGSGVASHAAGVSPALGAFVAGLLLGESPFAVQIRSDVSGLKTLLMTLFFTSMGMLADPAWMAANALPLLLVVAAVIVGKAAVVWFVLYLLGARRRSGIATGVCLAQIGEFSFVLIAISRDGLLDESFAMLLVSATVLSMLVTPYLVRVAPRLASRFASRDTAWQPSDDDDDTSTADTDRPHAIVVGFGPAGRALAERVAEAGFAVCVVDTNPWAARAARAAGFGAVTGDARHAEILEHAGAMTATSVFVTIPGPGVASEILRLVRSVAPSASTFARARFHRFAPDIAAAGADVVIDEEHDVGLRLAEAFERLSRSAAEPTEPVPDEPPPDETEPATTSDAGAET